MVMYNCITMYGIILRSNNNNVNTTRKGINIHFIGKRIIINSNIKIIILVWNGMTDEHVHINQQRLEVKVHCPKVCVLML